MIQPVRLVRDSRILKTFNNVKSALERVDVEIKLQQYNVREFRPNIEFSFERGRFLVKTAQNGEDLTQCLKLRYNVFHKEYMHKRRSIGIDVDHLDFHCDHLMIVDQQSQTVIGTYRLNSSHFAKSFYSENEFQMDNIIKLGGPSLELGRACIDRSQRTGVVIALLWRGISEYIRKTQTKVIFGCSSIKTIDPMEIALITRYLILNGYLTYEFAVNARRKYKANQLPKMLTYLDSSPEILSKIDVEAMIPPLFKSYLKMGAKLCGEPALDREFFCIDFLTLIQTENISSNVKGKFDVPTMNPV